MLFYICLHIKPFAPQFCNFLLVG